MSKRLLAFVAVLAVALAILMGFAGQRAFRAGQTPAVIGGPFELVDVSGATVNQSILKGKWSVVFFGFTHCPDICPTTMFEMAQVESLLGARADRLQTVFISVDPGRDTVQQMRAYAANDAFPKRLVALTGSSAQTDAAAKSYRAFYQKVGTGPDYSVNHISYSFLMNPRGKLACVLPYDLTPEQTAARVEAAMGRGDGAETC